MAVSDKLQNNKTSKKGETAIIILISTDYTPTQRELPRFGRANTTIRPNAQSASSGGQDRNGQGLSRRSTLPPINESVREPASSRSTRQQVSIIRLPPDNGQLRRSRKSLLTTTSRETRAYHQLKEPTLPMRDSTLTPTMANMASSCSPVGNQHLGRLLHSRRQEEHRRGEGVGEQPHILALGL